MLMHTNICQICYAFGDIRQYIEEIGFKSKLSKKVECFANCPPPFPFGKISTVIYVEQHLND